MITIHKFKLSAGIIIDLPRNAEILKVDMQYHSICMWVKYDTEAKTIPRMFRIFGTGWDISSETGHHVGTVITGDLVWHIFET